MSAEKSRIRVWAISFMIIVMVSCGAPAERSSVPDNSPASEDVTNTQPDSSAGGTKLTSTPRVAWTSTPRVTWTSTPRVTLTPLPPLPEFDQIITFGGGGGGGLGGVCLDDPGHYPSVTSSTEYELNFNYVGLCLWGMIPSGLSFRFELSAPNGQVFHSKGILVEPPSQSVYQTLFWDEYRGYEGFFDNKSDVVRLFIYWPLNYPAGKWHMKAYSGEPQFSADFMITRKNKPAINIIGSRMGNEVLPVAGGAPAVFHPLILKDNGSVDVVGAYFPTNATVYLATYNASVSPDRNIEKLSLINEQVVVSDSSGSIAVELTGPFKPGQFYSIVGTTDPQATLTSYELYQVEAQVDSFEVFSSSSLSISSCPGAPPQRMLINQRGTVCTKSDSVRLREKPSRSANTLTSVPTGGDFLVIDGPICADNWSWWRVRLDDGTIGWLSEGGDSIDPYFICPSR